jgi:hypothetical protein
MPQYPPSHFSLLIHTVSNKVLALDDKAKAGKKAEVEAKRFSELLERCRQSNLVRGGLCWMGGAIGLYTVPFWLGLLYTHIITLPCIIDLKCI